MRKAKTTFSVLGMVFAFIALALLLCLPFFDAAAAALTPGAAHSASIMTDFTNNIKAIGQRVIELPKAISEYVKTFKMNGFRNLAQLVFVGCFGLGTAAFVVTLVILCVKKHAKGLGLLIPLYVIALCALAIFGVLVVNKPGSEFWRYIMTSGYREGMDRISAAGYFTYFAEMKYVEIGIFGCIGLSFAFIGLAFIFYMGYAVKLGKARKEEAKAVEESKAEIKKLIKEALGE